jgi:hypothetical protein
MKSGDLISALVAAGGGGAMLAGVLSYEYRQQAAMRSSRQSYGVIFPLGCDPHAGLAALGSLAGLDHRVELVAEVVASGNGIHHLLHLPEAAAGSVIDHLSAALPGLRCDPVEARSTGPVNASLRFSVPLRALLRTDDPEQAAHALLHGLGGLRDDERVSLRGRCAPALRRCFRLRRSRHPRRYGRRLNNANCAAGSGRPASPGPGCCWYAPEVVPARVNSSIT